MAGGGSTFVATSEPFVEGGNGSPPAVTGNEAASAPFVVAVDGPSPRSARFSISVDGGTDSDLVVNRAQRLSEGRHTLLSCSAQALLYHPRLQARMQSMISFVLKSWRPAYSLLNPLSLLLLR